MIDNLFVGVFPAGISYADRTREKNGDYLRLAFLPYDRLVIEWEKVQMSDEMRAAIAEDAEKIIAMAGQRYPVSSSQTVLLGSKMKH